jgi:hypothetical protein
MFEVGVIPPHLSYYAAIRAALFPISHGQKNPTGIIESFAHDCSRDPEQWTAWRATHPGCNYGPHDELRTPAATSA